MNGAIALHEWMSTSRGASSPGSYVDEKQISWEYILSTIRWYTQQLNPPQDDNANDSFRTSGSGFDQTDSEDATGYYYGTDNSDHINVRSTGRSTAASSSRSTQNVKKELDENSSRTLLSLLSLLSYAAFKSDTARNDILDIRLTVPGSKRYVAVEDDALTILFSLLVTSISSDLRGMALSAISNLVRCTSPKNASNEDKRKEQERIIRCWELLELSQILPTKKFSQFSLDTHNANQMLSRAFTKNEVSLAFNIKV